MDNVTVASINNFGNLLPKADIEPPPEDPVFILSSGQLQGIISQAMGQALEEREETLSEALNGQEKLIQVIEGQAQETRALKSILEAQSKRLEKLEDLQEVYHGQPSS